MTTSARILTLPRTPAGRQLLRESVLERCGSWDFPDESKADEIDWDQLVLDLAKMLEEIDAAERAGQFPFGREGRR